ncbi:MAG TPA: 2OG-Fe(II) oxygenase [Polyangiales bacterium]|nr:2OG-Fe(II) oxygenase [Polyangiales bacterium]
MLASELLQKIQSPGKQLRALAQQNAQVYQGNAPFPHIVIDGMFDETLLRTLLAEFPTPKSIDWEKYDTYNEVKLASKTDEQLGPVTRTFLHYLNSAVFVEFLEEMTGILGLIPDPHLVGGGAHQIVPGGKLAVHADFNRHVRMKLDRRLNLLLYLNDEWNDSYGGHLQLWDEEMKKCEKKILPLWNRMVVFSTTDFSYHGHPDPLTCPPDRTRKSLALYYYSNGRPAHELSKGKHFTLWRMRPNEQKVWRAAQVMKKFVPPIAHDIRNVIRDKAGF